VILLFAGLFAHLLRRGSSSARFAIWFAGLLAIGSGPLLAIAGSWGTTHGFSPLNGRAAVTLPVAWALYLFVAWAVIATIALARIAVGFGQVWVLRRRSAPLDPRDLVPELRETLVQFRPARAVAILLSDEIQSPTAIGLVSPAIVLPRWLLQELSTAELRQVFLHELAHLRRWDDWSNLLQKIVQALFFFHPAVWWMERQISLEREMACDEAVLAQTGNPHAYAQCLVRLAERSFFRRSVMLAQAAVSRVGQTSLRVARILSAGGPSTGRMRKLIAPSFAAALIGCLALLARAPRLIAFENNTHEARPNQALAVSPRVPDLAATSSAGSALANVSRKTLAGLSPARLRPGVVAADSRNPGIPSRPDGSRNGVVEAKFDLAGIHQRATAMTAVTSSELVVVVVEGSWSGYAAPAVWQIQMWHITVLRSSKNPVSQATPQKVI
jgi:beta-lactamase regulating signal transducer with metallopeptidase domain